MDIKAEAEHQLNGQKAHPTGCDFRPAARWAPTSNVFGTSLIPSQMLSLASSTFIMYRIILASAPALSKEAFGMLTTVLQPVLQRMTHDHYQSCR